METCSWGCPQSPAGGTTAKGDNEGDAQVKQHRHTHTHTHTCMKTHIQHRVQGGEVTFLIVSLPTVTVQRQACTSQHPCSLPMQAHTHTHTHRETHSHTHTHTHTHTQMHTHTHSQVLFNERVSIDISTFWSGYDTDTAG